MNLYLQYIQKVRRYGIQFLAIILLTAIFASCNKEELKAKAPCYINIDSITLNVPSSQGTNRQQFKDAWVFVDDNLIGAFELPAKVPILNEGKCKVNIIPGIILNGFSGLRTQYTPILKYSDSLVLESGKEININPKLTYTTATKFMLLEDFDTGNNFFKTDNSSNDIVQVFGAAFEGNGCAYMMLDSTMGFFECSSQTTMLLPKGNISIFLEMHYKSNTKFVVAIQGIGSTTQTIGVQGINPTDEWKKIYIGLTPSVNSFTDGSNFKLMYNFQRDTSISKQEVFIDNVKVLY